MTEYTWQEKMEETERRKRFNEKRDIEEGCVSCLVISLILSFVIFIGYYTIFEFPKRWDKPEYKEARQVGTEKILTSLHKDAVNSANTIDITEFTLVSQRIAEHDSAHYAKKITKMVNNTGCDLLYKESTFDFDTYTRDVRIVFDALYKDEKFQKYADKYKHSIEQLAVRRRIFNQKIKGK